MGNLSILSTIKTIAKKSYMAMVDSRGGWFPWVREPYAGAWQRNDEWHVDSVLAYHAVYACISLISGDIAKLPFNLRRLDNNGIWITVRDNRYSKLLNQPNHYQNHIQFKQWYITSLLIRGNVYILKERDSDGKVIRLYILDSCKVTVMVAPDSSVYYQLSSDNLAAIEETTLLVPASEIIHDRMNCLFHPLVGVSPLFASGFAASQGLKIQEDSSKFFQNGATPGGLLTAPGAIRQETADRLKSHWDNNYTGANAGKIAVLGDGLKFEPLKMTAVDSQLIEQLRWTAEVVCSTFHVPPYKIGIGAAPNVNNIEALTQEYYGQCLQTIIESMELCLVNGLDMGDEMGVALDLDVLFRMDGNTLVKTLREAVGGSLMAPNEGRKRMNLAPVEGGDSPMIQQQNYSLAALAKRDSKEDPFATTSQFGSPAAAPAAAADTVPVEDIADEKQWLNDFNKAFSEGLKVASF